MLGIDNAITASLDSYTPSQITLVKGLVAGTVNLALGIALDGAPALRYVLAALAIGAVGYGLSIAMWITGTRLVGATRGQVIFALAPFIGALLAWPVNGDRLTATTVVAFTVSLVGVLVVATSHHRHTHSILEHAHLIDPADPTTIQAHSPSSLRPDTATLRSHTTTNTSPTSTTATTTDRHPIRSTHAEWEGFRGSLQGGLFRLFGAMTSGERITRPRRPG